MARRKLTPQKIQAAKRRKASGERYEDIARALDISVGSVSTALKSPGQVRATKAPPLAPVPSGEALPAGEDGGVAGLLETAERLTREAEAVGNLAGVATMGRLRVSLLEHQRKAAPPPTLDEQGMVLVPRDEMESLASEVEARLLRAIDLVTEDPVTTPLDQSGRVDPKREF